MIRFSISRQPLANEDVALMIYNQQVASSQKRALPTHHNKNFDAFIGMKT